MSAAAQAASAIAAAVLLALAGCIRLPSSDAAPSGTGDFSWRGSAALPGDSRSHPGLLATLGDPATSGLDDWTPSFDAMPKAFDLDGDGVDELAAVGSDGNVHVFRFRGGGVLARLPVTVPTGWYVERVLNGVEAGVLRPGDRASLVVTGPAAHVAVWTFTRSTGDEFVFTKAWERRLDTCSAESSMDAKATLADLDGDGSLEILVQTEEAGLFALRADGTTSWHHCWSGGNAAAVAHDLDGDGRPEAIFASDEGHIRVFDGATGDVRWTYRATDLGITPASIPTAPTVAELDGRAPREVVFTARNVPFTDPEDYAKNHMAIVAVHAGPDGDGRVLWSVQPAWANPLSYTRLVARDVDGDGRSDLFGMDWNTIGHKPGNWERLGPAHAFRLDSAGSTVWVRELETWWSNKDIALGDADGDGRLDVVANGPYVGMDGFWLLSAATGEPTRFLPVGGWKVLRGAQLLDLDRDGHAELVVPVEPVDVTDERGAILVIGLGIATDPSREPA